MSTLTAQQTETVPQSPPPPPTPANPTPFKMSLSITSSSLPLTTQTHTEIDRPLPTLPPTLVELPRPLASTPPTPSATVLPQAGPIRRGHTCQNCGKTWSHKAGLNMHQVSYALSKNQRSGQVEELSVNLGCNRAFIITIRTRVAVNMALYAIFGET